MEYTHMPDKTARVYEVMLPKKMSYASILATVLDSFIKPGEIESIPELKEAFDIFDKEEPGAKDIVIKTIESAITGYSIYEVDGRYNTPGGPIDERTWIIRFILHEPDNIVHPTFEGVDSKKVKEYFWYIAEHAITHLISKRFAIELGTEEEVWVLRYDNCFLQRWVRQKSAS